MMRPYHVIFRDSAIYLAIYSLMLHFAGCEIRRHEQIPTIIYCLAQPWGDSSHQLLTLINTGLILMRNKLHEQR
jgi:hypothetical protein